MEPTPIFAALTGDEDDRGDSGDGGGHTTGRPVVDLVRELRAERTAGPRPSFEVGTGGRAGVGDVPGLLSFRLPV